MSTKQTASELYQERRKAITQVMDRIKRKLDQHEANAKADPQHWGYPADLGYVREKLIETLAFLSNCDPPEIEKSLGEDR